MPTNIKTIEAPASELEEAASSARIAVSLLRERRRGIRLTEEDYAQIELHVTTTARRLEAMLEEEGIV